MIRTIVVVTVVTGRHDHLRTQLAGLERSAVRPARHVLVAMGDDAIAPMVDGRADVQVIEMGPVPGPLPLAAARNLGAAAAISSAADLMIFLDVDCIPDPDLVGRYQTAATSTTEPGLLCGPVAYLPPRPSGGYDLTRLASYAQPHPARPSPPAGAIQAGGDHRLFWSLSFAVTPLTWRILGGFSELYEGYGAEDTDLAEMARARGVELRWVGGATAYHQHHAVSDPPVEHLDDILTNARTFHARWGWWPMRGWLDAFARAGLVSYRTEHDTWARV